MSGTITYSEVYQIGDHLISSRLLGIYDHHGIYIGDNKVIHYSGFANGFEVGKICVTLLDDFCNGNPHNIRVKFHRSPKFNRIESIERAKKRLNEDKYSLIFNNCEHFVNYCIEGEAESHQVQKVVMVTMFAVFAGIGRLVKRF